MMLRIAGRLHVARGAARARMLHLVTLRAASTSASLALNEDALYLKGEFPTPFVGPIAPQQLPGRIGWGLVATRDIKLGELLAVSSPLAVVQGPADEMPDADDLLPLLQDAKLDAQQRSWLSQMFDGDAASTASRPAPQLLSGTSSEGISASTSSSSNTSGSSTPGSMNPDVLQRVVAFNAFGDGYEDLAASSCRGVEAQSHVGLWPIFNLLNHSCLPNTVHYVVGKLLVVRACRDIAAGKEVMASYLGRQEFTPAPLRRAVLQERYQFECQCERCVLELEQLSDESQALLLDVHSAVTQRLRPRLVEAATKDDEAALSSVGEELQELAGRMLPLLEGVLEGSPGAKHKLDGDGDDALSLAYEEADDLQDEAEMLQVQASVYDFLELLHMHAGLTGQDSSAELELCCRVVGAVSPGSELHCFQTGKLLAEAVKVHQAAGNGSPTEELLAAAGACQEAHRARYGYLADTATIVKLTQSNTKWSETFL